MEDEGGGRGRRPGAGPSGPAVVPSSAPVVLCVAADPDVRAALVALCGEVGARVLAHAGRGAPTGWTEAALVLVGTAPAEVAAEPGPHGQGATSPDPTVRALAGLPRRDGVVLVVPPGHDALQGLQGHGGEAPAAGAWRDAVALGAEHVAVLPTAREWLLGRVRAAVRPRAVCVGVVGARGGAGATAAAVALATAAARLARTGGRPRVVLLDADPHGGGCDLAMGAEELPGLRWGDLHDVRAPLPRGGLGGALPEPDGVRLLAHGRSGPVVQPEAAAAVLASARDEHDLVVVDLPRHPSAATLPGPAAGDGPRVPLDPLDVLLCVCPAEVRAAAAAPAVLRAWRAWPARAVHLLVRGPSPGGLRPREAGLAVAAGMEELGGGPVRTDVVRAEAGLAAALDHGDAVATGARSPLRRWSELWLTDVVAPLLPPGRHDRVA